MGTTAGAARGQWGTHTDSLEDIKLSVPQADVWECRKRFKVLIAGRRLGKTVTMLLHCIEAATLRPYSKVWYVGPTYKQAKDIAWDLLKVLVPEAWLLRKPNEGMLVLFLKNGSTIAIKGAEDWNSLRGRSLWYAALDEFTLMHRKVWTEAIRPALSDLRGGAIFGGTPMGFNWGYDLFMQAQTRAKSTLWQAFSYTTAQGGRVHPDELREAKLDLDPLVYQQEYEASFESLVGRVYSSFLRERVLKPGLAPNPNLPLLVGMDFNLDPMSMVMAQRVGLKLRVVDAMSLHTSNTEEAADVLAEKYAGYDITVYPDPAGATGSTKAAAGRTDFTILRQAGFTVKAPPAAPLIKDRVNNTNALFRRGYIEVAPEAQDALKSWQGLTYKEGTNKPDKSGGLDHMADAFDYLTWSNYRIYGGPKGGVPQTNDQVEAYAL